MKKETCWKCGSEAVTVERLVRPLSPHTPDLLIDGVERVTCSTCGEVVESWTKSMPLLDLVKTELLNKPRRLSPGEFRVLRQAVHPQAKAFAASIDVTPEILSKWENGKSPIPSTVDRLVRLMVAVRWGLTAKPEEWATLGADDTPLERRFVLGARGWRIVDTTKRSRKTA